MFDVVFAPKSRYRLWSSTDIVSLDCLFFSSTKSFFLNVFSRVALLCGSSISCEEVTVEECESQQKIYFADQFDMRVSPGP